ncbi:arsenate reductase/protein-tyrosine-phosphatase family protein [Klebsiella variicola]|uniref:arsenate reductase/protein-tyrosine-phosphatase family protein n=1 Tax=Klebsiella variicola TaxID=244366 RepID=UPI0013EFA067|nr:protein tyrosine phosphatase [Klebsiella variicola]ELA2923056.1 protein tyrosine phosphatase [Klebsiella variicola]HBZ7349667.1 protein tyrosine phosphatase [Klebsiella variicola subsp. variicola]HCT8082140.1 protein tyrosine phosphatase [Klebsiella variicola]HCT9971674.1 protein tyrosine phosphatase [Klebsiella variicola]
MTFDNILVICTGNICRSPLGERLLRNKLPAKVINSAGTSAMVDHPADRSAIKVAEDNGISLEGHKGKQLTREMIRRHELILVMEQYHIEHITKLYPESRGKILLYGHWINQKEIPDPYRKSEEAFISVFKMLELAAEKWTAKLGV